MLLGIAGRRRNNITAESSGWGFVFSNNGCDSDSPSIAEIIADPKNLRIRLWLYCHCGREDKIKVLPFFFFFQIGQVYRLESLLVMEKVYNL